MRVNQIIPALFFGVFVLTGCEGSKYPLSSPADSAVDWRLNGSWIFDDEGPDEASYINIFVFNDHEYYVENWEEGEEDEMVRLNVFSTEIDGVLFANMRCINCDDDESEYLFLRYELQSDHELLVSLINDNVYSDIEDLESVDAVHYFFRQHLEDADFFENEAVTFRRLDEEPVRRY